MCHSREQLKVFQLLISKRTHTIVDLIIYVCEFLCIMECSLQSQSGSDFYACVNSWNGILILTTCWRCTHSKCECKRASISRFKHLYRFQSISIEGVATAVAVRYARVPLHLLVHSSSGIVSHLHWFDVNRTWTISGSAGHELEVTECAWCWKCLRSWAFWIPVQMVMAGRVFSSSRRYSTAVLGELDALSTCFSSSPT